MLVIGLTGGIGSGKSTAAAFFAEQGVSIIDADLVAREITLPEKPAYLKIIEHFGPAVLLKDETLDRKKLRQIIFTYPNERLWLENLLHPLIREEIENQIQFSISPYCIIAIPLLIETLPYPFIDRILVVDAPESQQIERVALRDHQSFSEIQTILKTQSSRKLRLKKADDVIENNGTLEDLKLQVKKWHQTYLELCFKKASD